MKPLDTRRGNVRWAFDEAVKLVGCTHCDVDRGEPCVDDKRGNALSTLHMVRLRAYHTRIGAAEYALRHSTSLEDK